DELPVAGPDGTLLATAGYAPEERALDRSGASFEDGKDVHPFERGVRWNRGVAGREQGGGKVHRDAHLAGYRASRNVTRPPDDRRHTDSALPEGQLVVEQRRISREPLAAVV